VLRELTGAAGSPRHVTFAATHDSELVELLQETFATCHFGDAVGPEGLLFDFRLQPGPATTRNAIALLRLHGAPERVLARALSCAADLDRQRGTTLAGR
jgi:DNA mismatch repair ATPase MutS